MGFAAFANGSERLETYYPEFEKCIRILNPQFIIEKNSYSVKMAEDELFEHIDKLDYQTRSMVGQIAIEWDMQTKMPPFESLKTEAGRRQLAGAILTLEAQIIIRIVTRIASTNKVMI